VLQQFLAYSQNGRVIIKWPSVWCLSTSVCLETLHLSARWPFLTTLTQWSPGVSPSRLCSGSRSRSKVTRYWHSVNFTKIVIRYSFPDNAIMGSQTFWDKMHATAKQIAVLQQTFTQSFPGTAASRTWSSLRSRSNVTIYRHFCNFTNIYTGPTTTTKNGHS